MQESSSGIAGSAAAGLEAVLKGGHPFVLGVTGGIACGKTTVVKMLEERGAEVIDFDLIAREIVEPGKPAWRDIVGCFGEGILRADGSLDRERLSDLIFRDPERRRELEGFTHPRIDAEFVRRVRDIGRRDPDAVIQADIPLLIEIGLQRLFHRILVVYVPREVQIERLVLRDGISREKAEDILRAQMPIDEKTSHADFVIHNEGSLAETERQVEELWKNLKILQFQGRKA